MIEELIGESAKIMKAKRKVKAFAKMDVPVLILGEVGCGKERIARTIHFESVRKDKTFTAVHIETIPKEAMESQLFGTVLKKGRDGVEIEDGFIRKSDGGGIYLNSLELLPIPLQFKLITLLKEKKIFPKKSLYPLNVDVRVYAGSSENLLEAVRQGRFLKDLYYLLSKYVIEIPPLRQRKEDILPLAEYFLSRLGNKTPTQEVKEALVRYPWPGNVREFKSILNESVLLSEGDKIGLDELNEVIYKKIGSDQGESFEDLVYNFLNPFISLYLRGKGKDVYRFVVSRVERPLIKLILEKVDWNRVKAAEMLGMSRNTLAKRMKELKIVEPLGF